MLHTRKFSVRPKSVRTRYALAYERARNFLRPALLLNILIFLNSLPTLSIFNIVFKLSNLFKRFQVSRKAKSIYFVSDIII